MAEHYMSSFLQGYGEVYFLNLNEVQNHSTIAGQYALVHSESYGIPSCSSQCKFKVGQCPTCPYKKRQFLKGKVGGATYPPDGSRIFEIGTAGTYPILALSSFLYCNLWRDVAKVKFYAPVTDSHGTKRHEQTLIPMLRMGLEFDVEPAKDLANTRYASAEVSWSTPSTDASDFLFKALSSSNGVKPGSTVTFGFTVDRPYTFQRGGYSPLVPSELHRRYGFQFCQIELAAPTLKNPYHREVIIGIKSFPHDSLQAALQQELIEPQIARYACNVDRSVKHQYIVSSVYNYDDPARYSKDESLSELPTRGTPLAIRQGFAIQEDATATRGITEKHAILVAKNNPPSLQYQVTELDWQRLPFPEQGDMIGLYNAPLDMPEDSQLFDIAVFEEWLSKKNGRNVMADLICVKKYVDLRIERAKVRYAQVRIFKEKESRDQRELQAKLEQEAVDDESMEYLEVEEPPIPEREDACSSQANRFPKVVETITRTIRVNMTARAYIQARLVAHVLAVKYRTARTWKHIPSTRRDRDDTCPKYNKPFSRDQYPGKDFTASPLKNNKRKIELFREMESEERGKERNGSINIWDLLEPPESPTNTSPCRKVLERLELDKTDVFDELSKECESAVSVQGNCFDNAIITGNIDFGFHTAFENPEVEVDTVIEEFDLKLAGVEGFYPEEANDTEEDTSLTSMDEDASDGSTQADNERIVGQDLDSETGPTWAVPETLSVLVEDDFADAIGGNKENVKPERHQRIFSNPQLIILSSARTT